MAPQTPAQKRANQKFMKDQQAKMGTYRAPTAHLSKEERRKLELSDKFRSKGSSVGKGMVLLLVFLLVGGFFFEVIRLFL